MNQVALIGRIVADANLYYVGESETPLARFRIAVKRRYRNGDNNDQADFFTVKIWGDAAERLAPYLKKGRRVAVNGELRTSTYETQDGDTRTAVEIISNVTEFLDPADETASEEKAPDGASANRKKASNDASESMFEEEPIDDSEDNAEGGGAEDSDIDEDNEEDEDDRYVSRTGSKVPGALLPKSKVASQENSGEPREPAKARVSNRFTSFKKDSKSAPF